MSSPKPPLLVVDDDPLVLRALERTLGRTFAVSVAPSPGAALAAAAAIDFALIVTDHNMPGSTGVQLARQLRAAGVSAPIVLLTAAVDDQEIAGAIAELGLLVRRKPWGPGLRAELLSLLPPG